MHIFYLHSDIYIYAHKMAKPWSTHFQPLLKTSLCMLMSTPAERASLAASEPLAANPELPRWEVNVPGSCSDP